jgi:hypothetical protein
MVVDVLVTVCRHRAASIPSTLANNVDSGCQESICIAHDCADIEVVLPILDCHMEAVAPIVEVVNNRVDAPVPVPIGNIAVVAVGEQVGVEVQVNRPRLGMWSDAARSSASGGIFVPALAIGHSSSLPRPAGLDRATEIARNTAQLVATLCRYTSMTVDQLVPTDPSASADGIAPGTILINREGDIKIIRTRTSAGTGWNCADGAAIEDVVANDTDLWNAYSPKNLANDLRLARELHEISGSRLLAGGLATWDACSGRPCQIPKLAKLVH